MQRCKYDQHVETFVNPAWHQVAYQECHVFDRLRRSGNVSGQSSTVTSVDDGNVHIRYDMQQHIVTLQLQAAHS